MLIYIVRHAWAADRDSERFPDDDLRPLTPEGQRRFRRVVGKLVRRGFRPQRVWTSPLVRAVETAEVLTRQLRLPAPQVHLELAPGGEWRALLEEMGQVEVESLAWVGHAPDVSQYVAGMVSSASVGIRFGKGAVAAVQFDAAPRAGQGSLQWLASARLLGC